MRFLVTAIGSMAADAVIASLRKHFPDSQIIGTDIHPKEWLYLSDKVDAFFKIPKATDPNFIISINQILDEQNIDLILPLTDSEVDILSENRDKLTNSETILTLPDDNVVKVCRNKEQFAQSLKKIRNINVIETYLKGNQNIEDFCFPLVAKPKKGRSSEGFRYIESEAELSFLDDDYLIQPFIEGDIITVDVVRDRSGNFACLSRRELIRSSNGAGLSVEVFQDNKIEKLISTIVEILNITGCMNIEFIESEGLYYLMDINPRFSAGVGFSTLAGYDFILNHVRVYTQRKILPMARIETFIAAKNYTDSVIVTPKLQNRATKRGV